MISQETYSLEYVNDLHDRYNRDSALLERVLFAFGLLEAIARVGMPFIFKGGTSLMLLLDHPLRLFTDIDILVPPGTDVDRFISEASEIFPFKSYKEDRRVGHNKIEKRHFKFIYNSPLRDEEFYILLDVVFAESPYQTIISREVKNDLLLTEGNPIMINIPSPDCILGDKLTAFAPHTTGIPFGVNKELEIVKQLFDVATLSEKIQNNDDLASTYAHSVEAEIGYRNITVTREDVLYDTIQSCACIIGKGNYSPDEYPLFIRGVHAVGGHVLSMRYTGHVAAWQASCVMHLASCLLTGTDYVPIKEADSYSHEKIGTSKYKKLSYMRGENIEAFAHIVEAIRLLKE